MSREPSRTPTKWPFGNDGDQNEVLTTATLSKMSVYTASSRDAHCTRNWRHYHKALPTLRSHVAMKTASTAKEWLFINYMFVCVHMCVVYDACACVCEHMHPCLCVPNPNKEFCCHSRPSLPGGSLSLSLAALARLAGQEALRTTFSFPNARVNAFANMLGLRGDSNSGPPACVTALLCQATSLAPNNTFWR